MRKDRKNCPTHSQIYKNIHYITKMQAGKKKNWVRWGEGSKNKRYVLHKGRSSPVQLASQKDPGDPQLEP